MRQLSKRQTFCLLLFSFVVFALSLHSASTLAHGSHQRVSIMKRDPVAISGRCQVNGVSTEAEAAEMLGYYKIRMNNSRPEERLAMANGLFQATALNGEVFKPMVNTRFEFQCRRGPSRQTFSEIQMNRCSGKKSKKGGLSSNGPHLLHEIGHKVGNSRFNNGRGTFYSAYSAFVKGNCNFTGYAGKSRNEQFSEAFAAYLTRPELLSQGNSACRRAYSFFADRVFAENGRLASCSKEQKNQLMARLRSGGGMNSVLTAMMDDRPRAPSSLGSQVAMANR